MYFKNPEFDPQKAQWRGENVILLEKDKYFAHGLGILNAQQIIDKLNSFRRKGAVQSAYLLSQATRLDIPSLYPITR